VEKAKRQALERFIAAAADADSVTIGQAKLMVGGAVQENWLLEIDIAGGARAGHLECVLRSDSVTAGVAVSHGRAHEFELLRTAFSAGITVPEPLWLCQDPHVIGRPFFVMRRVRGTALGHLLVKGAQYGGDRAELANRLGRELARIHSIRPPRRGLEFLALYDEAPALRLVALYRAYLDSHQTAHAALEWGLRWLERHAPPRDVICLCHRDYRTGNYMVDETGLTGVLDWEFAGWSDPLEDIGWFCAKCWRFGKIEHEAGGIGARDDFYRGYEAESGKAINREAVRYWEVMAHVKWAIIAIQQAERHVSGEEDSLLLALTGHIVPELEWEILNMTQAD
jgi:aminoglycoside phosphotransferase (APT) family kinase protein